jgi:hypothetical protein
VLISLLKLQRLVDLVEQQGMVPVLNKPWEGVPGKVLVVIPGQMDLGGLLEL